MGLQRSANFQDISEPISAHCAVVKKNNFEITLFDKQLEYFYNPHDLNSPEAPQKDIIDHNPPTY